MPIEYATRAPLPVGLQRREQLTALARLKLRMPNYGIDRDLAKLTTLTDPDLTTWWNELHAAVREQQGLQWGSLHWSEVLPDAAGSDRDGQALDAVSVRVELALDALLGEAS